MGVTLGIHLSLEVLLDGRGLKPNGFEEHLFLFSCYLLNMWLWRDCVGLGYAIQAGASDDCKNYSDDGPSDMIKPKKTNSLMDIGRGGVGFYMFW